VARAVAARSRMTGTSSRARWPMSRSVGGSPLYGFRPSMARRRWAPLPSPTAISWRYACATAEPSDAMAVSAGRQRLDQQAPVPRLRTVQDVDHGADGGLVGDGEDLAAALGELRLEARAEVPDLNQPDPLEPLLVDGLVGRRRFGGLGGLAGRGGAAGEPSADHQRHEHDDRAAHGGLHCTLPPSIIRGGAGRWRGFRPEQERRAGATDCWQSVFAGPAHGLTSKPWHPPC